MKEIIDEMNEITVIMINNRAKHINNGFGNDIKISKINTEVINEMIIEILKM